MYFMEMKTLGKNSRTCIRLLVNIFHNDPGKYKETTSIQYDMYVFIRPRRRNITKKSPSSCYLLLVSTVFVMVTATLRVGFGILIKPFRNFVSKVRFHPINGKRVYVAS